MSNQYKVDAILMASGFSNRFGEDNKLLAPVKGMPLIEHTLRLVTQSHLFGHVFVVYAAQEVLPIIKKYPVVPVFNAQPQLGQRESVRLGVEQSGADFYAFFPCDQPFLTKSVLKNLVGCLSQGKITVPFCCDSEYTPSFFSSDFRKELLTLREKETPKKIKKRHPKKIVRVLFWDETLFTDIDTKEQYLKLD